MKLLFIFILVASLIGCSEAKKDHRTDQDKALEKHNENVEDKLDRSKEIKDKSKEELDSIIK